LKHAQNQQRKFRTFWHMSTKHRAISCDVQNVIGKTCTIGRQISPTTFCRSRCERSTNIIPAKFIYEYLRKWALPFPTHPNPSHTISVEEQLAGASFITCTRPSHRTLVDDPCTVPTCRTHIPFPHTAPLPYPASMYPIYRTHVPNVPYPCTQCAVPMYPMYRTHVPNVPYTCTQKP